MTRQKQKREIHIGYLVGALVAPFVLFGVYLWWTASRPELPVYSESLYQNDDFRKVRLWNQHNQQQRLVDAWKGKVVLVNFFFTHCANICPPMMNNLKTRVAPELIDHTDLQMASISVDYRRDSVPRLQEYAHMMGIDQFSHWMLYTAPDKTTHLLARNAFKTAVSEIDSGINFIHSGLIILLDQEGRMRGFYDSNDPTKMTKLVEDAEKLL